MHVHIEISCITGQTDISCLPGGGTFDWSDTNVIFEGNRPRGPQAAARVPILTLNILYLVECGVTDTSRLT